MGWYGKRSTSKAAAIRKRNCHPEFMSKQEQHLIHQYLV